MTYGNFNQSSLVSFAQASVCFEEQQLRTLEETVLRTGCIFTKGHPFQAYGCIHAGFTTFRHGRYTAVYTVASF